ncbi:dihydrolipoyl dehydrogenase family protein [Heyndrickxia acidicola]|uniref:FAD-dependent oxidoreductase n=1 Tax=Heyndrickxia acidicola TaxID=209389 RepID=A0ABU6MEP8_9BACI|nr:FAD-dependent oxidoreductase [Heyndrickxia acidicola]MED1202970.1 FAD-dependent oxidoreductase [Heyndrickxia acidicola]
MVVGEMIQEKQVVVIGGGPAGYTAAIRAAQLGKDVMLIEKNRLGGICLNEGCIPSKTLAYAAAQLKHTDVMKQIGIQFDQATMDFEVFRKHRDGVVEQLRKGVEALCKENMLEVIYGDAHFLEEDRIAIERGQQFDIVQFEKAIVATGASREMDEVKYERKLSSAHVFHLDEIPETLILAGIDYIVLEAAFAYSSLGTEVVILMDKKEHFPVDKDIEKELIRQIKKQKIKFHSGVTDLSLAEDEKAITCTFRNEKGELNSLTAEYMYVREGWKGNTESLGLNRIGLLTDQKGFIKVDQQCKTNLPSIYAAGDVTGAPLLAIKGIKQGKAAAEAICGIPSETDFTWIPSVIHTSPPIAYAGLTEQQAATYGYSIQTGQYRLNGNGYAVLTGKRDGLLKLVKESESGRLLGMHIIGEGAIELISAGVLGGEMVARDEDFLFPSYPHPSFNEGILEAMEDMAGLSIHQKPKKRELANRVGMRQ